MLANTVLAIVLIALITSTILGGGLALTRVTIHRYAQTYLSAGYQRALGTLRETLAQNIVNGAAASPLPVFTPLPAQCVDGGTPCSFTSSETITLTGTGTSSGNAPCDPAQSNCALNAQANRYVAEGRLTARIVVSVSAADGTVLAMRSSDTIVRTIALAPYVFVTGRRDATFDDVSGENAPGDDGGAPPATPDPCASVEPGTSDNTVIRVAYQNALTAACSNGSAWRSAPYNAAHAAPPGWSP